MEISTSHRVNVRGGCERTWKTNARPPNPCEDRIFMRRRPFSRDTDIARFARFVAFFGRGRDLFTHRAKAGYSWRNRLADLWAIL